MCPRCKSTPSYTALCAEHGCLSVVHWQFGTTWNISRSSDLHDGDECSIASIDGKDKLLMNMRTALYRRQFSTR